MASRCMWIWVFILVAFYNRVQCQRPFDKSVIAKVVIHGDSAIAETDNDFICATLDWWPPEKCDYGTCSWGEASMLNLDLESPLLANAIKAFDPLKLRLGGSLQDQVIYDVGDLKQPCHPFVKNNSSMFGFMGGCLNMSRWDALNSFFKKTRAVVAFGLNALIGRHNTSQSVTEGPWDSRNAHDFIQYTVDRGYKISVWELGNELCGSGVGTSVNATQYAADVIVLKRVLKEIYKGHKEKPLLVAPGGFFDADWFKEFLQVSGPNIVNVVTHHIYNLGPGVDPNLVEKILDPSYLSRFESTFKSLKTIVENYGPWSSAWVGEAGGAYNSGHNLVSNAFVYSFWYLDQLGMASKFNTKSYCRQSLIGGNYGLLNTKTYVPNPDYYSALLWQKLMGRRVLSISSKGSQYLRAYAHCTKKARGVTLLLINLSKSTRIFVPLSRTNKNIGLNLIGDDDLEKEGRRSRMEYHLTAKDHNLHSQTMLLNGKALELTSDGKIPSLEPVEINARKPISLAPLSIAFVTLPFVQLPACSSGGVDYWKLQH
ncbi:heparanase-like protein 3 [Cryptomeria japonica]|uniref:heparanase-like protein 3 n=1 Tax=Cryptomeria japonica TaxID=3369 RepID=UPI0027DA3EDB|nr:heparanase-like protein 3 [Cryptomeria japonica]